MKKITKIGIVSIAKVQAVITGALYFVSAAAANILGRISPDAVQEAGIQVSGIGIIYYTVACVLGGFVAGAVIASVYNAIAPKIGAIEVEIK